MQTFVPYEDFTQIAECLDYRRLGKQRVECMQILNALKSGRGWSRHPAVLMWTGYEAALRKYQRAIILEWIRRGFRNTMTIPLTGGRVRMPDWWGGPIHATHRAALLYKDPNHYSQFGWIEEPKLDYFWPSIDGE